MNPYGFVVECLCLAERLTPITPLARRKLPMDESLQSRAANADDLTDSLGVGIKNGRNGLFVRKIWLNLPMDL